MGKIIVDLQEINWHLAVSSDDFGHRSANSCLFFRRVAIAEHRKRDGEVFLFSPSGEGSILLIDVPERVERDLVHSIAAACTMETYELLDTREGPVLTSRLNMGGLTWSATGDQALSVRKMILSFVQSARKHKYELVSQLSSSHSTLKHCTVQVSNLNTKGTTDSLVFQHRNCLQDSPEDMLMISLNREDLLRLISCPGYVVTAVEEVIREHWQQGLQASREREACWELKLSGTPWWAEGEDTVKARYLVAHIISRLKALGWEVAATTDLSRKGNNKTAFVFRQAPPEVQPFSVLSFHESDKLRLMSSCDEKFVLADSLEKILSSAGLTQSTKPYWKAKQWKLKGSPFSGDSRSDADEMILTLTRILKQFHQQGWRLAASADVSAKHEDDVPLSRRSWFFLHDPKHVPV